MSQSDYTNYHVSISKAELAELPAASFKGSVVVVDKEDGIAPALEILRKAPIVGFDTETRPAFKKGVSYKVALLQLSAGDITFLFRLNKIGLHPLLIDFLEDRNVHKIGLSIHDDFHTLGKLTKLNPEGFTDLQIFVKQFLISDNSLSRIYAILFGKRISKGQRLTNWEASTLTEAQQIYAALDALACIRIYNFLNEGRFVPQNSKYFQKILPPEDAEQ